MNTFMFIGNKGKSGLFADRSPLSAMNMTDDPN